MVEMIKYIYKVIYRDVLTYHHFILGGSQKNIEGKKLQLNLKRNIGRLVSKLIDVFDVNMFV